MPSTFFFKTCVFIVLLFPVAKFAQAQVNLEAAPGDSCYLAGEPVALEIRLRNTTGQPLVFGGQNPTARMTVSVEHGSGRVINPMREAVYLAGVAVMPSETRNLRMNLGAAYYLRAPGAYHIECAVFWEGRGYAAPTVFVDVRQGAELLSEKTGLPLQKGAGRTYTLKYLQKKDSESLYLLIKDDENKVSYGVFNLGGLIRFYPPELRVDDSGNAHILFQTHGGNYMHTVFTPFGVRLFAHPYAARHGVRFRLVSLPGGRIGVDEGAGRKIGKKEEFVPVGLDGE